MNSNSKCFIRIIVSFKEISFLPLSSSEAIDNAQHKKVIQMVDKILKKSPNLHCAKASWGEKHLFMGSILLLCVHVHMYM